MKKTIQMEELVCPMCAQKIETALKKAPGAELFAQLREASGNYAVPADACPTYEKTYRLLEELENEFSA